MKPCAKCHIKKPLAEFTTRGGNVRPRCRACRQETARDYYERTKERFRELRRATSVAWQKANPQRMVIIKRRYRARLRERWWVNGI